MATLQILLVEDNYGDERLVREALYESGRGSVLLVARDGAEALAQLKNSCPGESPRIDVIFLDLHVPKISGLEVLAEIRRDPKLESLPVVMFTTSDSQKDRQRCLELMATEYLRKPIDLDEFLKLIMATESHWIGALLENGAMHADGSRFPRSISQRDAS